MKCRPSWQKEDSVLISFFFFFFFFFFFLAASSAKDFGPVKQDLRSWRGSRVIDSKIRWAPCWRSVLGLLGEKKKNKKNKKFVMQAIYFYLFFFFFFNVYNIFARKRHWLWIASIYYILRERSCVKRETFPSQMQLGYLNALRKKIYKKMGKANQANSTWLRCLLIPWGLHRQTLFIFVLHWHKPRVDSSGLCIYPCALNRTTSWAKCTVLLFLSAASWFESQTQSLIQKSFEPLSVCCLLMDEGQRATTVPRFLLGCYPSGTDDGWLARLFIYLF